MPGMERQTISLRIEAKELKRVDELCAGNCMERTTFINFAIESMLDYAERCGVVTPAGRVPALVAAAQARGSAAAEADAAAITTGEGGC